MPNQLANQHQQMMQTLSQFDIVVVSIHTSGKQNDFSREITDDMIRFLKELELKPASSQYSLEARIYWID